MQGPPLRTVLQLRLKRPPMALALAVEDLKERNNPDWNFRISRAEISV